MRYRTHDESPTSTSPRSRGGDDPSPPARLSHREPASARAVSHLSNISPRLQKSSFQTPQSMYRAVTLYARLQRTPKRSRIGWARDFVITGVSRVRARRLASPSPPLRVPRVRAQRLHRRPASRARPRRVQTPSSPRASSTSLHRRVLAHRRRASPFQIRPSPRRSRRVRRRPSSRVSRQRLHAQRASSLDRARRRAQLARARRDEIPHAHVTRRRARVARVGDDDDVHRGATSGAGDSTAPRRAVGRFA